MAGRSVHPRWCRRGGDQGTAGRSPGRAGQAWAQVHQLGGLTQMRSAPEQLFVQLMDDNRSGVLGFRHVLTYTVYIGAPIAPLINLNSL